MTSPSKSPIKNSRVQWPKILRMMQMGYPLRFHIRNSKNSSSHKSEGHPEYYLDCDEYITVHPSTFDVMLSAGYIERVENANEYRITESGRAAATLNIQPKGTYRTFNH